MQNTSYRILAIAAISLLSTTALTGAVDETKLNNCLCYCGCEQAKWNCDVVSCYYSPSPRPPADECYGKDGTNNYACMCEGFGCGRAEKATTGDCFESCMGKYVPKFKRDNLLNKSNKVKQCENYFFTGTHEVQSGSPQAIDIGGVAAAGKGALSLKIKLTLDKATSSPNCPEYAGTDIKAGFGNVTRAIINLPAIKGDAACYYRVYSGGRDDENIHYCNEGAVTVFAGTNGNDIMTNAATDARAAREELEKTANQMDQAMPSPDEIESAQDEANAKDLDNVVRYCDPTTPSDVVDVDTAFNVLAWATLPLNKYLLPGGMTKTLVIEGSRKLAHDIERQQEYRMDAYNQMHAIINPQGGGSQ